MKLILALLINIVKQQKAREIGNVLLLSYFFHRELAWHFRDKSKQN